MSGKRSYNSERYECTLCKAQYDPDWHFADEETPLGIELASLPSFSPYYYCTPECYLGVRRRTEKGRDYERIKSRLEEILERRVEPRHGEFRVLPQSELQNTGDKRIRVSLMENDGMELEEEEEGDGRD